MSEHEYPLCSIHFQQLNSTPLKAIFHLPQNHLNFISNLYRAQFRNFKQKITQLLEREKSFCDEKSKRISGKRIKSINRNMCYHFILSFFHASVNHKLTSVMMMPMLRWWQCHNVYFGDNNMLVSFWGCWPCSKSVINITNPWPTSRIGHQRLKFVTHIECLQHHCSLPNLDVVFPMTVFSLSSFNLNDTKEIKEPSMVDFAIL